MSGRNSSHIEGEVPVIVPDAVNQQVGDPVHDDPGQQAAAAAVFGIPVARNQDQDGSQESDAPPGSG